MKKLLKPLGRITLIILISWVIYGIVKLFQGEGDVIDVIGPICILIFFYVFPSKLFNQNSKLSSIKDILMFFLVLTILSLIATIIIAFS